MTGFHDCRRLPALLAATAITLIASATFAQAEEAPAEVIHWMTAKGESAALRTVVERFEAEGGTWVDSAIAPGSQARSTAATRVVSGNPPTAMMFVTKLQVKDLLDNGLMADITAVAEEDNWDEVLPPEVLDALTYNGQVFATPLDFQLTNIFWYNKEVYAKAGVEPPKTWDEVAPAFEKLKAAGVLPLAMQSEDANYRNVFNAVVLGIAGPDIYNRIYRDRDVSAVRTEEFRNAVETFRKLKDYTDAAAATRTWTDAARMMIQGEAATQILGSWVKGEVTAAGKIPDEDIGCALPSGVATINTAMITFPKRDGEGDAEAQAHLARVFMDPAGQAEFSKIKGSLPPRIDADTSGFDACAQSWIQTTRKDGSTVFDAQVIMEPARLGTLIENATQYWAGNLDTDQFIENFATALTAEM
jgi:glucose/mannose transport system substrate-binding protein